MKKKISMLLAATLSTITLSTFTTANAAELAVNPIIEKKQEVKSVEDCIKLIESKYLIQNEDGTSYISPEAKDVIPLDILEQITYGMNWINSEIKNNNLKVVLESNGLYKIIENNTDIKKGRAVADHMYNFKFFWWGYIANVDKVGARQLINDLEAVIGISGGATVISGVASFGVGTVVCTVAGGACIGLRRQALNSLEETPNGVTMYCYGSPKAGQLYKVTRLYN